MSMLTTAAEMFVANSLLPFAAILPMSRKRNGANLSLSKEGFFLAK